MSINYKSTRGKQVGLTFEEVVLGGLATDKGLFVPEIIPTFEPNEIEMVRKFIYFQLIAEILIHSYVLKMRYMSFPELAFRVISKYVSEKDIPSFELKMIVEKSFASFRSEGKTSCLSFYNHFNEFPCGSIEVTPSIKLSECWVLELFHGPTFAFKDVALQFLGNIFEYFLLRGKFQKSITILGATSGDTGSAAIHGLRGKANVNCFIMFPTGKVTDIQQRQMTTIPDRNVDCISMEGDFDDCQAIVKAAFADETFRKEVKLGAINSINWARVLAQITYYFYSYLRVTDTFKDGDGGGKTFVPIHYAVPTGNFGDILAGYFAKRMGLPIGKLIICTNQNDVLHRFLQTGLYRKDTAVLTIAPSMDISVSSNFERYLYYVCNEKAETLALWMDTFERTGELTVNSIELQRAQSDFLSCPSTKEEIIETMSSLYRREKYLVCPHTATAIHAIRKLGFSPTHTVCLATAHPAKFEEAIGMALAIEEIPPRPPQLEELLSLPTKCVYLPNSLGEVQEFIRFKLKVSKDKEYGFEEFVIPIGILAVVNVAIVATFVWSRYFRR